MVVCKIGSSSLCQSPAQQPHYPDRIEQCSRIQKKVNTATEVRGISRQSYAKSHWKKIAMAFPRQPPYLRRGQLDNHDCIVGQRNFNIFVHVGKTVENGKRLQVLGNKQNSFIFGTKQFIENMANYQQKHDTGSPFIQNILLESIMFKFSILNCMLCFT